MNDGTDATRRRGTLSWQFLTPLAIAVAAIALAACGGGSGSGSAAESDRTTAAESGGSTTGTGAGTSSEVAAAKKVVDPYIGQPSPFPVTEPLKELPPKATVAYTNCGTPVCSLMYELLGPAASAIGFSTNQVKTGPDAKTLTTGLETIVSTKPDGLFAIAAELELWQRQLKELQDEDVAIATNGIAGAEAAGIEAVQSGEAQNHRAGELLANYVVAEMSPEANVVVYQVPELSFSGQIATKFVEELEAVCSACSVRTVDIPVATLGNTASNTVVSDLQAHPDTDVGVFTTDEIERGLPSALQTAGIEIETLGYNPSPDNLQYIKEGKETAGLGFDLPVSVWSLTDMLARQMIGQPLSGPASEGYAVNQFLRKEDITFDPSKGWTGYPDFAERFEKLWGVGK